MSEDGGSPRPVDPNAMDVDTGSPPAVTAQTGECVRALERLSPTTSVTLQLQLLFQLIIFLATAGRSFKTGLINLIRIH